jgi:hypothetical protein
MGSKSPLPLENDSTPIAGILRALRLAKSKVAYCDSLDLDKVDRSLIFQPFLDTLISPGKAQTLPSRPLYQIPCLIQHIVLHVPHSTHQPSPLFSV